MAKIVPNAKSYIRGNKIIYSNEGNINVVADTSGYLRIFNSSTGNYCDINGKSVNTNIKNDRERLTHFKIKKRGSNND